MPLDPAPDIPACSMLSASARLDVAIPEQVYIERIFDVAAAVRRFDSPLLAEDDLTRVKSGDVRLFWPESESFVRLRLHITAPECQIIGEDDCTFLLPKDEDSPIFYFHLIPQQLGNLTVILTLYQEDDILGNTRIRTNAVTQIAGEVSLAVTSQEIPVDLSDEAIVAALNPPAIPPYLSAKLRNALAKSPLFASDATLQTLFVDTRLAPWRDLVPDSTTNRAVRVNGIIHTLYDRTNTVGENALALFLHVLADNTDPTDALHSQLLTLANDLDHALTQRTPA